MKTKNISRWGVLVTLSVVWMALNMGGVAGCGEADNTSNNSATPAGSTNAPTTESGKASQMAAAVVFGSTGTAASQQGNSSSSSSLILESGDQAAATINLDPPVSVSLSIPCTEGTIDLTGTMTGSVTTNDVTKAMESFNFNLNDTIKYNACRSSDVAATTTVNESDFTVNGTITGTMNMNGTSSSATFTTESSGSVTLTPVAGVTCSGGTVNFTGKVSGTFNSGSGLVDCTIDPSSNITGTVCGQSVNCTVSGSCSAPSLGSGC